MAQEPLQKELSTKIQVQEALGALQQSSKAGKEPLLVVVGFSKMKKINEIAHLWGDTALDQIDTLFQHSLGYKKSYRLGASSGGIIIETNGNPNYAKKVKSDAIAALQKQFVLLRLFLSQDVKNTDAGKLIADINNYTINFYNFEQAYEIYKDKKDTKECDCKCLHNWNNFHEGFRAALFGPKDNPKKYQCLSMDIDHLSKFIAKFKTEAEGRKQASIKIKQVGDAIAEYVATKMPKDRAWPYHNSGDEFSMVITKWNIQDSITVAYQLIDYVKKQTGISITVGRSHAMMAADKALETAKKNGHRGIVASKERDSTLVSLVGPKKGIDKQYIVKELAHVK